MTFTVALQPATQARRPTTTPTSATAGAFQPNDHMLLLLNGLIVSGTRRPDRDVVLDAYRDGAASPPP